MVELNENNVNTSENKTEMTTTEKETTIEEETKKEENKRVVEDLSSKDNNNEHATTTLTTTTTTTMSTSTTTDNISIDDEKKNLPVKRIIQIIGKGHSKRNNTGENSKINNNDNDNSIIYEFDATSEDPFTLESFDTLIQQHSEKDKDFIVARVTTVDPSDELKTYHSYYSGHHINKVLFRTQPDQGLLHRMKAKNPLNNMSIIGDVHYYVVKASSVKKLPTFTKSSSMSTTSKKTIKVKDDSTIMATSSLDKVEEKEFTKIDIDNISDIRSSSNKLRSAPPSIWNFECNDDDDDDEKYAIEMKSTSNNKRWSADDSLKPPPIAVTANHNSSTSGANENFERLLTTFKLQTFNNDDGQSSKIVKHNLSSSPPNEISISISDNDLKEQQIDSSIPLTQSPTKDSYSILINDENEVEDGTIYYKAKFYATDDDFLMHSSIRHFFKTNALEPTDAQLFTINTSPHNPNMNISPGARLERIVTGHESFLLDPMVIGNSRSPAVTRSANSDESNAVPTSRWRRILNNLRMNKGLRWLVLMYMIFGFLLIRFVVAETYAYLMAFLLMLCLFLVFCVGSGVGIWGR